MTEDRGRAGGKEEHAVAVAVERLSTAEGSQVCGVGTGFLVEQRVGGAKAELTA